MLTPQEHLEMNAQPGPEGLIFLPDQMAIMPPTPNAELHQGNRVAAIMMGRAANRHLSLDEQERRYLAALREQAEYTAATSDSQI